jgi:uncharacterized RDD family membrane protein YckC
VDRRDIGSWLEGPAAATAPEGYQRGERLGRPAGGPGSVASFGRRLAALCLDWLVAIGLSRVLFSQVTYGTTESGVAILGLFFVEVVLLTWLTAASFGQRVVGIGVVRLDGGRLGLVGVLLRTLLLCLVVPAVVIDRDGRGLHDRAAGSVVIRLRGGAG